jgi:thioredoxin 1
MKKCISAVIACFFVSCIYAAYSFASAEAIPQVPTKDMVTMVDLGAKKCIPCKMMAPILEELQKEYKGKASIVFIDVWNNPEISRKFDVRAIPTQIFYDKNGKEVFRHTGFMDKKSIIALLEKLGVKN